MNLKKHWPHIIVVLLFFIFSTYVYYNNNVSYADRLNLEPSYIICIPEGNITNIFNTIWRCHEYAKKTGRILIIDTHYEWFNDDINTYIHFHSPYIYAGNPETIYFKIKNLSIYPKGVDIMNLSGTASEINYSLNSEPDEKIMVYKSQGQMGGFCDFLQFCSFSPVVMDVYNATFSRLPNRYIGVHIVSDNYDGDILEFIKKSQKLFESKAIFISSDNRVMSDIFRNKFGSNIYEFSNSGNVVIRENKDEYRKYVIDSFVDILLLASANEYYYINSRSELSLAITELREDNILLKRLTI